jgi:hypothetical protein
MEAALATRKTPLDRRALLSSLRSVRSTVRPQPSAVRFASVTMPASAPPYAAVTFAASTPAPAAVVPDVPPTAAVPSGFVSIPDVAGLPARLAARRLHAAGLRVKWTGGSIVAGSRPAAGAITARGDTVTLVMEGGAP